MGGLRRYEVATLLMQIEKRKMKNEEDIEELEGVEIEEFLFENSYPLLQKIDNESDMLCGIEEDLRTREGTCYYA